MTRKASIALLTLAMLTTGIVARGQEDTSISISRETGVDINNTAIAANTSNGTVLVVWREDDIDAGVGQIYSSLVKLRSNGKPKAKKPVLLVKDAGSFDPISLVYNPRNNTYLLSFERNRLDKFPIQAIFVQRLNAAGKKIGPENIVSSTYRFNRNSLLHFVEGSTRPGGEFIIFWEVYGNTPEAFGIWSTRIDATGKPIGGDEANVKVVDDEDRNNKILGNLFPEGVLQNGDGSFWLCFTANPPNDASRDTFLVKLSPAGKQQANIFIDTSNAYYISLAWLSNSRFAAFWVDNPSGVVQVMQDAPAGKIKKPFSPLRDVDVNLGSLLSLPSGGALAFVRNSASEYVEVVDISSKGKVGKHSEVVYSFNFYDGIQLRSALLSGKGTAALILFKTYADSDLRAIAYTVEQ